jgi:hypothetical protein
LISLIQPSWRYRALFVVSVLASACGGSSAGPSATALRITAVAPNTGTTIGGTSISIVGANFTAGATVSIGGLPATEVTVAAAGTITAKTPAHAAGTSDVTVVSSGQTASLSGAFTFVAPTQVANTPPVIASIVARGTVGPNEPAQFADLDEVVRVAAVVTDAETPLSGLTFAWTSDAGSFTGTGANVLWTAPHAFSTPGSATLTLTVTEKYQSTDAVGLPVGRENVVAKTSIVRVHNSAKEVGDLAFDFLDSFSKQLSVDFIMRNFTASCRDTASERSDVTFNQENFKITSYFVGNPSTTVTFLGSCPYQNAEGDACADVQTRWTSTSKATGTSGTVTGTDQVGAVVQNDQWRLCSSFFKGASSTFPLGTHFKR